MTSAEISIGSIHEGIVSRVTKFGAFVTLPNGQDGLVHISEIANVYVQNIDDYIKVKDKVKVKVINIDEKKKIALSIKQAIVNTEERPPVRRQPMEPSRGRDNSGPVGVTFEDKLSRFMKDSEERLSHLKRSTEAKRGGRGGRRG